MYEVDWSKAPEGAEYYNINNGAYYRIKGKHVEAYSPGFKKWSNSGFEPEEVRTKQQFIPRPVEAPWIDWHGGDCPVEEGVLVDVRYGDGEIALGVQAGRCSSTYNGRSATNWLQSRPIGNWNIIAYRLHQGSSEEADAGQLTDGTKIRMLTDHDIQPLPDLMMDAPGYEALAQVLYKAYLQSAEGKGKERHAGDDLKPFHEQPIISIQSMVGPGFALGQAIKKIEESQRMDLDAACRELLGAIVFIAGAIVHHEKQMK